MEDTFAEEEFIDLYDDDEFEEEYSLSSYDDEDDAADLCIYGCGRQAEFTYGPCDRRYCRLQFAIDHPESLMVQEV